MSTAVGVLKSAPDTAALTHWPQEHVDVILDV